MNGELSGVAELRALLEERQKLAHALIAMPVLKATCLRKTTKHYVHMAMKEQDSHKISAEEEPYMMTTMLLNVRMSQNRSRLIDNKKFISDQLRVIEQECVLSERRKARSKLIEKYNGEQAKSVGNAQHKGDNDAGTEGSVPSAVTNLFSSEESQEEETTEAWAIDGEIAVVKNKTTLTSQKVCRHESYDYEQCIACAGGCYLCHGYNCSISHLPPAYPFSWRPVLQGWVLPSRQLSCALLRAQAHQPAHCGRTGFVGLHLTAHACCGHCGFHSPSAYRPTWSHALFAHCQLLPLWSACQLALDHFLGFIMRLCTCYLPYYCNYLGIFSVFTPATCVADSLLPVESEEEEIAMRKLIAEEEKVALGKQSRVNVR